MLRGATYPASARTRYRKTEGAHEVAFRVVPWGQAASVSGKSAAQLWTASGVLAAASRTRGRTAGTPARYA